jgi:hypothetical protein
MYELDGEVLLRDRTHERSIMFHVGRHLAAEVDGWGDLRRVDLEYNRLHQAAIDAVTKRLVSTECRDEGPVLPDLILHDRSRQLGGNQSSRGRSEAESDGTPAVL